MGADSKIQWCDDTFNPWWGCTKIAAGCAHCYADTFAHRLGLPIWGDGAARRFFGDRHWAGPVEWNRVAEESGRPRRVFCASMCDVCEDRNDLIEHRIRLKRLIIETRWLDWLLLSKRPENYLRLFWGPEWWPSNVWAGCSVAEQKDADRNIPHLLRVPAAVRFISLEPLIGPVKFAVDSGPKVIGRSTVFHQRINWVIVGGESGPMARPCNVEWIRSIIGQTKAAGISCFVKQLGAKPTYFDDGVGGRIYEFPPGPPDCRRTYDRKGGDVSEWPADLRVREFPKMGEQRRLAEAARVEATK